MVPNDMCLKVQNAVFYSLSQFNERFYERNVMKYCMFMALALLCPLMKELSVVFFCWGGGGGQCVWITIAQYCAKNVSRVSDHFLVSIC